MQSRRKLSKAMVLWPGLPQLWKRGSWAGLVVAVGFTTLVNLLLLSSLVYRDWFSSRQQLGGLAGVICLALWAWWQNRRDARREALATAILTPAAETELPDPVIAQQLDNREQWFSEAQQAYLQGDWVATEQLLLKLLKLDAQDAAARLMLATLWRKQRRLSEAQRQLDKLSRQENSEPWQFEIAAERAQLQPEHTTDPLAAPDNEAITIKMTDPKATARQVQDAGATHGITHNQQPTVDTRPKANDPTEQRYAA